MKDYNLAGELLRLHADAHAGHFKSQIKHAENVSRLNGVLRDISHLTNLLTEKLPSGVANLTINRNLVDRVRLAAENLLIDSGNFVWNSADKIKAQLDLLKEKSQHLAQEINLVYTKMSQGEKDWTEVHQICFEMIKQNKEQMKTFQRLFG